MPETQNRPLRVFLCHASQDKPAVQDLCNRLKTLGWVDPWLDEEKLFPGQDWNLEIEKAVEAADIILVCLSNNSITKEGYIQRELRFVLDIAEYKPEGTLFIIPVRLEDCEPPRRLKIWQYADFFPEEDRNSAFERLLVSLRMRANRLGIPLDTPVDKPVQTRDGEKVTKKERQEEKKREEQAEKPSDVKVLNEPLEVRTHQLDSQEKKSARTIKFLPVGIGSIVLLALASLIIGGSYIYKSIFSPAEPSPTQPLPVVIPTYLETSTQPSSSLGDGDSIGDSMVSDLDGMAMLYIPAGEFIMGSGNGEEDEKPAHVVHLNSFWIDQTEVTNIMYSKCVQAGECKAPISNKSNLHDSYYDNHDFESHPVIMVSWDDADSYCKWAGRRLPTEAEWEKAARGGLEGKLYPWGNDMPVCENEAINAANFTGDEDCDTNDSVSVKSFAPNGFGVYDMAGNVWEWVADNYGLDYYRESPYSNPQGADVGDFRVIRGGSWKYESSYLRSAFRGRDLPAVTAPDIGFRCALDAPP